MRWTIVAPAVLCALGWATRPARWSVEPCRLPEAPIQVSDPTHAGCAADAFVPEVPTPERFRGSADPTCILRGGTVEGRLIDVLALLGHEQGGEMRWAVADDSDDWTLMVRVTAPGSVEGALAQIAAATGRHWRHDDSWGGWLLCVRPDGERPTGMHIGVIDTRPVKPAYIPSMTTKWTPYTVAHELSHLTALPRCRDHARYERP